MSAGATLQDVGLIEDLTGLVEYIEETKKRQIAAQAFVHVDIVVQEELEGVNTPICL